MSNNNTIDNGLLGFLQKRSLFQNEPKHVPRKRNASSRSNDDRNSIINKINQKDF